MSENYHSGFDTPNFVCVWVYAYIYTFSKIPTLLVYFEFHITFSDFFSEKKENLKGRCIGFIFTISVHPYFGCRKKQNIDFFRQKYIKFGFLKNR